MNEWFLPPLHTLMVKEGILFMSHKKKKSEEANFEGREEYFMDVDRMINEGMSGGIVFQREEYTNIEEARELEKESPPNES